MCTLGYSEEIMLQFCYGKSKNGKIDGSAVFYSMNAFMCANSNQCLKSFLNSVLRYRIDCVNFHHTNKQIWYHWKLHIWKFIIIQCDSIIEITKSTFSLCIDLILVQRLWSPSNQNTYMLVSTTCSGIFVIYSSICDLFKQ